jgi:hypothetical protein
MKFNSFTPLCLTVYFGAVLAASALEVRTWTSVDGRTLEAEFVKMDDEKVTLKDKMGRQFDIKKAQLSQADLRYLQEFAPKSLSPMTPSGKKPPPPPMPGKEAKIDQKTFKKLTETFVIPGETFYILETPHFLVMHSEKTEAGDLGETAERMWLDMNFFHPGFSQKFQDRRMAVFLVDDEYTYKSLGEWYAGNIKNSGMPNAEDNAANIAATWPRAAAAGMHLTGDLTEKYKVLSHARVFRAYQPGYQGKQEKVKGVWVPFRVHCLASDMVDAQTGGVSGFGAKGLFAIETGHAYYKEIQYTGKSETSLLRAEGTEKKVDTTGGFDPGKSWPEELKKLLRREKVKPSIQDLWNTNLQSANVETNALAYSFSRYLQSTTERLANYSKLLETIDASHQIPEPESLAKLYGFENVKAMEADWIEYLKSPEFR